MENKVFGVGLSRSGTSSLSLALNEMGIATAHCPHDFSMVKRKVASTDSPVAALFKDLDRIFPDSQFILTVRDKSKWLESCEEFWRLMGRCFNESLFLTILRRQLYGSSGFDRGLYSEAYDRHHDNVYRYFSNRPTDLLVLNVGVDTKIMEKTGVFLNREIPYLDFPRSHSIKVKHQRVYALMNSSVSMDEVCEISYTSRDYLEWVESNIFDVHDASLSAIKGSKLLEDMIARAYLMYEDREAVSELLCVDLSAVDYVVSNGIENTSILGCAIRRAIRRVKRLSERY